MMSGKVRQAIRETFAEMKAMSEDELIKEIDSHPKTEWSELLKEAFGESTLGDIFQDAQDYMQTECLSTSYRKQDINSIQFTELYSIDSVEILNAGDMNLFGEESFAWAA